MTEKIEDVHDKARDQFGRYYCRLCADAGKVEGGHERYSMGIFAMTACDAHWEGSGFRDVGADAFDPLDAGERLDPDDP